jgi:hypothetical protein
MKCVIPGKFPKVFDSASVVCHCRDIKGVRQRAIPKKEVPVVAAKFLKFWAHLFPASNPYY